MPVMKAIRVHEYGGPEVLKFEDVAKPEPGPGEVFVEVHAASMNPVDWMAREGSLRDYLMYALPMTPGLDYSGVVAALGPGVHRLSVGDQVYGKQEWNQPAGTHAEYVVVESAWCLPKPRTLDHVHAAAVPVAASAAWQALFPPGGIDLIPGQTVLVNGAAGGVGTFAVQLARWAGATVTGTGSTRNEQFLSDLGVDRFVDYTKVRPEDFGTFDAVVDTVGGAQQARLWSTVKPGGVLASLVGTPPQIVERPEGARGFVVMGNAATLQSSRIGELIDQGVIKPVVTEILPLSEARRAHEISQSGHARGKIVLRVKD